MKRFSWSLMSWAAMGMLILLCAVSCKSWIDGRPKEPPYVVFINNSGADLFNVSAREVADSTEEPARLASVSPLLAGKSYTVPRDPDSKPLSSRIRVNWDTRRNGGSMSTTTSIEALMRKATGAPNEALVISLDPAGFVSVHLAPLESIPSY